MEKNIYKQKMKLIIEGKDMTKNDLVEIGKFLTKFFENRKDLIGVFIEEGTEDMTKEECAKLIASMFENKKHYTKIFEFDNDEN